MYKCLPACVSLLHIHNATEARREPQIPWNWSYNSCSFHVDAGNWTQVLHRSNKCWAISSPPPQELIWIWLVFYVSSLFSLHTSCLFLLTSCLFSLCFAAWSMCFEKFSLVFPTVCWGHGDITNELHKESCCGRTGDSSDTAVKVLLTPEFWYLCFQQTWLHGVTTQPAHGHIVKVPGLLKTHLS